MQLVDAPRFVIDNCGAASVHPHEEVKQVLADVVEGMTVRWDLILLDAQQVNKLVIVDGTRRRNVFTGILLDILEPFLNPA